MCRFRRRHQTRPKRPKSKPYRIEVGARDGPHRGLPMKRERRITNHFVAAVMLAWGLFVGIRGAIADRPSLAWLGGILIGVAVLVWEKP